MLLNTMNKPCHQLFVFARFPEPGRAKTRLIPTLGSERAARLSRRLTEHAVAAARGACKAGTISLTVCSTGSSHRNFSAWLGSDLRFLEQSSGDIGERMRRVFEKAFAQGAPGALLTGSDLQDISSDILKQAAAALKTYDVVLGPAADGGYYLIGMQRYNPELFKGINWGSARVAEQTRAAIKQCGLTCAEVSKLCDVDRPEDLEGLRNNQDFNDVFTNKPLISVIIPTLNEAEVLSATLERINQADGVEIIVADGESSDATRAIAEESDARVITATGGRAAQLNAGASIARGRHLLFLHADTLLPEGFDAAIRRALNNPATVAGAFRFRTDRINVGIRMVEWGTNIRSSVFHWPYGDQGLFFEKRVFDELGGFSDMPIMEDFELVQRLRRRGRIVTVPETVITSARRWKKLGLLRTMLRNQAMILGYFAGIRPERLARFYRAGTTEQV